MTKDYKEPTPSCTQCALGEIINPKISKIIVIPILRLRYVNSYGPFVYVYVMY